MRKLLTILLVPLAGALVYAHVGSPDVYYEGDAGPYHLFVSVRLPQIDVQNRVLLDMVVGAKDPAPIVDLLQNLERAPEFGSPWPPSAVPPGQNEKLLRYRVIVHYAQKL